MIVHIESRLKGRDLTLGKTRVFRSIEWSEWYYNQVNAKGELIAVWTVKALKKK